MFHKTSGTTYESYHLPQHGFKSLVRAVAPLTRLAVTRLHGEARAPHTTLSEPS